MFKVIAINTNAKPETIPNNKWIVKDEIYTVIQMDYLNMQNKILGFKLKELNINDCLPYQYFAANRFRPLTKQDQEAEIAVKKLLEETEELNIL